LIAPTFAEAESVRLVQGREELGEGNAQAPREPVDHVNRWRLPPAFQIAQVRPMQAGPARQFFLRDASSPPQFLESAPEGRPQIVHGGIVPSTALLQP
jgi:hypothetical protein